MKKSVSCTLVAALLLAATASAQEREYTRLERELDYLLQIWPGDYDNVEQTSFDAAAGKPTVVHRRVHTSFTLIDKPELGEHVLEAREYWDNDAAELTRHEYYAIVPDEDVNALRVTVFRAADGSRREGCDILLRRDGMTYAGNTDGCGAAGTYGDYALRIAKDRYEYGEVHASDDGASWYQLEKARWFACMIDFPRESGGRPVVTHHYIKIHDQGGIFPFVHPDGRPMVLLMRNTWSYGMQRETFFIGVMDEEESGPTLVYAWGTPGADRIGVNPGYLRVQCDLDSPRIVELQHGLRPDS